MKNEHMVPIAVKDIAEQLDKSYIRKFNRDYHIQRLESIRDFCEEILKKTDKSKK